MNDQDIKYNGYEARKAAFGLGGPANAVKADPALRGLTVGRKPLYYAAREADNGIPPWLVWAGLVALILAGLIAARGCGL